MNKEYVLTMTVEIRSIPPGHKHAEEDAEEEDRWGVLDSILQVIQGEN